MIELINGYYAKADNCQYVIGKPKAGNDGVTRFREPHYFPTMLQAVRYTARECMREKVAEEEITTLKDFLREAEALRKDIISKLEGLEV